MAEVERRGSLGEDYPDEAVLRRAYGRWVCAVRAAARLARPREQNRVASSYHHCRLGRVPYGMQEVQDALLRGRADIGSWPSEWEYHEWAAIKRRISREDLVCLAPSRFENASAATAKRGRRHGVSMRWAPVASLAPRTAH